MPAVASLNSTNVRHAVAYAWHRLQLSVASALAPRRAVALAARLFATPPGIPHTEKERAFLEAGEGGIATAEGMTLATWRYGDAHDPVVILSHGWGGRGAQLRSFVQPLRERGFQVVLFDHVGHGASPGEAATLVHFVRGLDAVARAQEARGATIAGVLGHSLGAAAAIAWLNDTQRDLRAVLVASPISVERYSAFFARRFGIGESVRRAMQDHFERALGKPWRDFELPQGVARVRAKALVVHDEGDHDVSFGAGVQLARALPGCGFLATRGLGHRAILREAGVTRDAADFIAGRVAFAPPPSPGQRRAWDAPAPLL